MSLIEDLYGPFFDLNNWVNVVSSTKDWLVILSLAIIECLLSVDNAIVLATQTKKLSTKKEQEKSLFYGLGGAYIFRFLLIGLGVYLIHFWEIKVIGSVYLLYLALKHFYRKKFNYGNKSFIHFSFKLPLFWSVIISIELMDLVFSVDSVLSSLAISRNPVIVLIGGLIGILAMRGVANLFIRLINKIPELETMAYFLIVIIAIKLLIEIPIIDIHVSPVFFGMLVLFIVLFTIIVHYVKNFLRKNN
ncbi:MAG: DUF475 domain-containing protein [Firmicutes bacterium]|uniref:DUF475 domain-containing protein n=1 Tax=Candidatus Gallilactobacillus intestinavium TaxID=2840838 RepID=A0A9D9E697_9LACO|nr:DUF475 domain-containing protein [Candidatus Gallilactobacillus intestinavium]